MSAGKRTYRGNIREAEEALEDVKSAYLIERGWTHSSSHPGCYWLWSKEIDGKTYATSLDLAVGIQGGTER